jgi:ribosomal protein S18 acetylase RimI-like enzyme
VAHRGPEVVGTAALTFLGDGVAQMVRVSVSCTHRRHGIGRMLVNRLLDIAREQGIIRIEVETNNDWEDAIGLYRRHGFVEHDRDEGSVYMSLQL